MFANHPDFPVGLFQSTYHKTGQIHLQIYLYNVCQLHQILCRAFQNPFTPLKTKQANLNPQKGKGWQTKNLRKSKNIVKTLTSLTSEKSNFSYLEQTYTPMHFRLKFEMKSILFVWFLVQLSANARTTLRQFQTDLNRLKQNLMRASSSYHMYPCILLLLLGMYCNLMEICCFDYINVLDKYILLNFYAFAVLDSKKTCDSSSKSTLHE